MSDKAEAAYHGMDPMDDRTMDQVAEILGHGDHVNPRIVGQMLTEIHRLRRENKDLTEEWGILDEEDSGFIYDGPTGQTDAREAYDQYHHHTERIRVRIVGPWKDSE